MELQIGKFSILLLKVIYSSTGIFSDPASQKYYLALVLATLLFFLPVTLYYEIVAFILTEDTTFRANTVAQMVLITLLSIIVLWTQLERARWTHFYESVRTLLADQYFNDEFEALLKADINQLIFFFGIVNSILIFPVLNISGATAELGSYETLLVPAIYPWPSNTPLWYAVTIIFQLCSITIPALCIVGHILFVYYFRALITSLNAALKRKIAQLKKQRDGEDMEGLRDVIRSHRDVTRFGNQYKRIMALGTHVCIINFFISGVFIVATLLRVENNLLHRLKLMNIHAGLSCHLLFYSSVGQIFDETNTQVMQDIYEIDWFEKSIAFRKEMITFMIFLQKQQQVKVFKVKVLNWVFVASIVRTTYSMLQVFIKIMRR